MEKRRVLFVCTHNSARSQMAEGMLRAWARDRLRDRLRLFILAGGREDLAAPVPTRLG